MSQTDQKDAHLPTRPENFLDQAETRPWPVTALALLLMLQALGLLVLGLVRFREFDLARDLTVNGLAFRLVSDLVTNSIFIPLALLALWAAIGFLRLWRSAWLNAMLLQGLSLLAALIIYIGQRPDFVYIIMAYSIFMVVYLHAPDVQLVFQAKSEANHKRDEL